MFEKNCAHTQNIAPISICKILTLLRLNVTYLRDARIPSCIRTLLKNTDKFKICVLLINSLINNKFSSWKPDKIRSFKYLNKLYNI